MPDGNKGMEEYLLRRLRKRERREETRTNCRLSLVSCSLDQLLLLLSLVVTDFDS